MLKSLSPKVVAPAMIVLLAALALYLLTGDSTWLVTILLGLVGGGIGVAVPPASGVTQASVRALAQQKASMVPPAAPDVPAPPQQR